MLLLRYGSEFLVYPVVFVPMLRPLANGGGLVRLTCLCGSAELHSDRCGCRKKLSGVQNTATVSGHARCKAIFRRHQDSASVISIAKNARSTVAFREDFQKMRLPEKLKGDFLLSIFSMQRMNGNSLTGWIWNNWQACKVHRHPNRVKRNRRQGDFYRNRRNYSGMICIYLRSFQPMKRRTKLCLAWKQSFFWGKK